MEHQEYGREALDKREVEWLSRGGEDTTSVLIRRAAIRSIIAERAQDRGVRSVKHLRNLLARKGIRAEEVTVRRDVEAIGAIKVSEIRPDGKRTGKPWFILPGHLPKERRKTELDPKLIENEAMIKLRSCAIECFAHKDEVVVNTELLAGPWLAVWLRNLPWPEIVYILDNDSTVVIRCASEAAANRIRLRLTGVIT